MLKNERIKNRTENIGFLARTTITEEMMPREANE